MNQQLKLNVTSAFPGRRKKGDGWALVDKMELDTRGLGAQLSLQYENASATNIKGEDVISAFTGRDVTNHFL